MLKIDLAELIRQTGKQIAVTVDDRPASDEDITYLSAVKGRIVIANTGDLVLVRGHVKTGIAMECGRCLGEVRQLIEADIEEQYTLAGVAGANQHDAQISIVADEENEVPPGLMAGTVMDLGVVIRQAVILCSPLSPLCKPDCLGMCPTCGKNRNDPASLCRCHETRRNTPLAALKELYASQETAVGDEDQKDDIGG
jgi:uncharacterized protein